MLKDALDLMKNRPSGYFLNLLSEECAELVQASLKLQRAWKGYTPKSIKECEENLIEEMADVTICLMLVSEKYSISQEKFEEIFDSKVKRLYNRAKTGKYLK